MFKPHRIALAALFAVTVLLALIGATGARSGEPTGRACFDRASWGAGPGQRPCFTATPPYEDGSGRVYVGTARRVQAVCVIPNVTEERGRFAAVCYRR